MSQGKIAAVPTLNRKGEASVAPAKVIPYRRGQVPCGPDGKPLIINDDDDDDDYDDDEEDEDDDDDNKNYSKYDVNLSSLNLAESGDKDGSLKMQISSQNKRNERKKKRAERKAETVSRQSALGGRQLHFSLEDDHDVLSGKIGSQENNQELSLPNTIDKEVLMRDPRMRRLQQQSSSLVSRAFNDGVVLGSATAKTFSSNAQILSNFSKVTLKQRAFLKEDDELVKESVDEEEKYSNNLKKSSETPNLCPKTKEFAESVYSAGLKNVSELFDSSLARNKSKISTETPNLRADEDFLNSSSENPDFNNYEERDIFTDDELNEKKTDEDNASDDDDEDDDDDDIAPAPRLKPVFVPRHLQTTRIQLTEEETLQEEAVYAEAERRRAESRILLEEEIKREKVAASDSRRRTPRTQDATSAADPSQSKNVPADNPEKPSDSDNEKKIQISEEQAKTKTKSKNEAGANDSATKADANLYSINTAVSSALLLTTVDDTDFAEDYAVDYAAWRDRELARLRRDYETRRMHDSNKDEVERKRNEMTRADREREIAETKELLLEAAKNKPRMKFLQRYYHKGGFYQEDAGSMLERNYNEATLEDRFEREALPEVMQRKNFGMSGQTKWTHLTKEDTFDKNNGWYASKELTKRRVENLAGTGDLDEPYKRRRKD